MVCVPVRDVHRVDGVGEVALLQRGYHSGTTVHEHALAVLPDKIAACAGAIGLRARGIQAYDFDFQRVSPFGSVAARRAEFGAWRLTAD